MRSVRPAGVRARRCTKRSFGFTAAALAAGLAWTGGVPLSRTAAIAQSMNALPASARPGVAPAQEVSSGESGGSVLDGVFTPAQASRGAATFRQVCSACHDTGEFSGGRFRLTWVGQTAGDLFDSISTLMPEGDPGSLNPAEYAAVVAYLLQLNGYPAGEAPLPANLSALQGMEIVEAP